MKQKSSALPTRLLQKLACPKCRGELQYQPAVEQLTCGVCRLGYMVRQGVPVLLIDEAITIQ